MKTFIVSKTYIDIFSKTQWQYLTHLLDFKNVKPRIKIATVHLNREEGGLGTLYT